MTTEEIKTNNLAMLAIIKSGYAGILPNGNIVDRRIHKKAVPVPENPWLKVPKPKKVQGET